jgi:hypothetical protein
MAQAPASPSISKIDGVSLKPDATRRPLMSARIGTMGFILLYPFRSCAGLRDVRVSPQR